MIQTWIADLSSLWDSEILEQYMKELGLDTVLGAGRQEKAEKIKSVEGKLQSIGAGILLTRMRRYYGLGSDFKYNLSHSGKYALCSVEDRRGSSCMHLGCDIEVIKGCHEVVARRFFTGQEYRLISGISQEEKRTEMFYRYWVLKESFMKATRLGMKLPMNAFEIRMEAEGPVLTWKPKEIPGAYFYREYYIEGIPARIAVCADADTFTEEIRRVYL